MFHVSTEINTFLPEFPPALSIFWELFKLTLPENSLPPSGNFTLFIWALPFRKRLRMILYMDFWSSIYSKGSSFTCSILSHKIELRPPPPSDLYLPIHMGASSSPQVLSFYVTVCDMPPGKKKPDGLWGLCHLFYHLSYIMVLYS